MASAESELGPIDPANIPHSEDEKSTPWIVRKLVGSMTGRIIMSSYESLRATGTMVVCLSPWGDSSPLLLPCIRFRDLVVHSIVAATGGMAAVATPIMGPVSDIAFSTIGDSILVEAGLHAGFHLAVDGLDELVISEPVHKLSPLHSRILETRDVKTLTITLKYKHIIEDAQLGFFRSSKHRDSSLFSSVKDYLAVEKGWFSPYLFASGRRPIIPRTMKPDMIFCHGPFLGGDYKIGEALLAQSVASIHLCDPVVPPSPPTTLSANSTAPPESGHGHSLSLSSLHLPSFSRSRSPSPSRAPSPSPSTGKSADTGAPSTVTVSPPRRFVLTTLAIAPHRAGIWTSSQRPSESVLKYTLFSGCPAVVLPAKSGAPIVAWDCLTLDGHGGLWEVEIPAEGEDQGERKGKGRRFEGVVDVVEEFVALCVDWDRVKLGVQAQSEDIKAQTTSAPREDVSELEKRTAVRRALEMLVAGAVRSGENAKVRKEVDGDRAGIVLFRIP
ncbi:hypothetical protein PLICRDRAFT_696263 [Plicaturopsis crispa FD-325 SS-3]|nr:hypothetical protein PLICRDRAFT_696263 [Plicaturopsis crispa FD-325 SS-3]